MEFYAVVFKSDLQFNGACAIFFNKKQHHLQDNMIYVKQKKHQQQTEEALLKEVKAIYPTATLFDDNKTAVEYRSIKR